MLENNDRLRIALVAGTLGKGGAEKQLVFMVRALKKQPNVDVQVYCATRGEFYEQELIDLGCQPIWFGRWGNPLSRVATLTRLLRRFRPHVIQSCHFYTNLYVALTGRFSGTLALGGLRNDATIEVESNGRWGKPLIRFPPSIIANSHLAKQNAQHYGVAADRIHVLSNVIDFDEFDRRSERPVKDFQRGEVPTVIAASRLVSAKRLDRFVRALQLANEQTEIRGVIVGDGSERENLQSLANELGLVGDKLRFLGWRNDMPALLRQADLFVTSSDHEGFPNVLLEAMAAGLPAVGTPAGDVAKVISDGVTGYVVPFEETDAMVQRMVQLATDADLRNQLGHAARIRAQQNYSPEKLAERLLQIYRDASLEQGRTSIQPLLSI